MDVQAMWQQCSHSRVSEVAAKNGLTTQQLVALFDQTGLTGRTEADPGPEEIAAATRALRSQWTPEQERSRWIAARRNIGWV